MRTLEWKKLGGVIYFDGAWQQPNKTEQWVFESAVKKFGRKSFVQLVCFPWATLIDLLRRNRSTQAAELINLLNWSPPKTTFNRATVMQHIWALDMVPYLKKLGITDLYWSHATEESAIVEGMRIHPFPLYPIACGLDATPAETLSPWERKYLYSFVGAYDPQIYLSPTRQWIFDLPQRSDVFILKRDEWHLQHAVYENQIELTFRDGPMTRKLADQADEYRGVLDQSLFSLCPSGSGPSTIRLWECIGAGCIPVVFKNSLRFPGDDPNWAEAVIAFDDDEQSVAQIDSRLRTLFNDSDLVNRKLDLLSKLWIKYLKDFDPNETFDLGIAALRSQRMSR